MGLAARFLVLFAGFHIVLFLAEWRTMAGLEQEVGGASARALDGLPPLLESSALNELRGELITLAAAHRRARAERRSIDVATEMGELLDREPLVSWVAGGLRSDVGLLTADVARELAGTMLEQGVEVARDDPPLAAERARDALALVMIADASTADAVRQRSIAVAGLIDQCLLRLPAHDALDPVARARLDPLLAQLVDPDWFASALAALVPSLRRETPRWALFERSRNARAARAEWRHLADLRAAMCVPFDPTRRDPGGRLWPGDSRRLRSTLLGLSSAELANLHLRRQAAVARLAWAARAHRAEGGALPASLAELAPRFEGGVAPIDPATGLPFRFTLDAGGWIELDGDALSAAHPGAGAPTGEVLPSVHRRVR